MTQQNPGSPNLYGWDLACQFDMTPDAQECGGITVLANALFRRAISPRGCLIDDPNYGFDLNQFVNIAIATSQDVAKIGAGLDAEFSKDQRVYRSTTVVQYTVATKTLKTSSVVVPKGGPSFTLVLGVSALNAQGVQILSVTPTS